MQLRKVLPLLAVSTFCLVGCASKVDYAKFNEQAKAAAEKGKDVSYSKVVLKGTYVDDDGKKQKYDDVTVQCTKRVFEVKSLLNTNLDEAAAIIVLNFYKAENIGEDENITYYAGSTFKIVYEKEKQTVEFNEYGLLTSIKDADSNLKVSYTK